MFHLVSVGPAQALIAMHIKRGLTHCKDVHSMKTYDLIVQNRYFSDIEMGRKIVEARVNKYPYNEILVGDQIQFRLKDDPTKTLLCVVRRRSVYKTFKELLEQEAVHNCLPGIEKVEEGVALYHAFPGYASEVGKHQAVAFRIHLLEHSDGGLGAK